MTNPPRSLTGSIEGLALAGLIAVVTVTDLSLIAPFFDVAAAVLRFGLAALVFVAVPLILLVGATRQTVGLGSLVLGSLIASAYSYSGAILPWTEWSLLLARQTLQTLLLIPVVGESLADAVFGSQTLTQTTLQIAFVVHYVVVAVGILTFFYILVDRHAPVEE